MTVSDMIATGAEYMRLVSAWCSVLALFYVVIKLMAKLCPRKRELISPHSSLRTDIPVLLRRRFSGAAVPIS